MNNSLESPSRKVFNGSKEENAIREIFYQHWEKIRDQMSRTSAEINRWRQKSIADINTYADQELQTLNDYYVHQRHAFDESRRANIDTAKAYVHCVTKQSDLFDELRNACSTLTFQMAKLEMIKRSMDYIKVITIEDHTKKMHETSIIKQSTRTNDNIHKNISSSTNSITASSDKINQQSPTTETFNNDGLWTDSNDNQKIRSTKDDGLDNKCPICFMIYPLSMNYHDRSLHVNQH